VIAQSRQPSSMPIVALVDIGNSGLAAGTWSHDHVQQRRDFDPDEFDDLCRHIESCHSNDQTNFLANVVISSVVPSTLATLAEWIEKTLKLEPLIIGRQVALPIDVALPAPYAVGVDRICCAAAAYHFKKDAVVVVDFGTAITVDAVDDQGAFMGGAIYPGLELQALALHEHTALLPKVRVKRPESIIGENTAAAIESAIYYGTAGAVRGIVERYAEQFGKWPWVIATGGDAALLAEACQIFDTVIPDLCLIGVGLAYDKHQGYAVSL